MWRRAVLVLLVLLALLPSAYLAWRWRHMPHAGIYHDDAVYLVTAKSLASGNGYRIESLPGEPAQTKYPPAYPLLLSAVWKLNPRFPDNLPLAALLSWLFLPVSLALAWRLFRDGGFRPWEAGALCLFLALNPVMVMFSLLLMSELPFCALLLVSLIFAERALRPDASSRLALLAGLAAGAAFLTRTAALPLLVTAPLCFLWRKQPAKAGLFLAGMLPAVAGWQWWAAIHRAPARDPGSLFYTDYLGYYLADVTADSLPRLLYANAGAFMKGVGELLVFDESVTLGTLTLARLLTVAVVAGGVRLVRRGRLVQYAAFSTIYTAVFLLWNHPPNSRFLLPLLPLIAAAAYCEGKHLFSVARSALLKPKMADRLAAGAAFATLAVFLCSSLYWSHFGIVRFLPQVFREHQAALDASRPALEWLAANGSGYVLSYRDPIVYLYTGRQGRGFRIPPHLFYDDNRAAMERYFDDLPELARRFHLSYVLRTGADFQMDAPERVRPLLARAVRESSAFALRYQSPHAEIYQITPR